VDKGGFLLHKLSCDTEFTGGFGFNTDNKSKRFLLTSKPYIVQYDRISILCSCGENTIVSTASETVAIQFRAGCEIQWQFQSRSLDTRETDQLDMLQLHLFEIYF
jgi:hypothetical protein